MTAVLSHAADGEVAATGPWTIRSRWYWRNWPVVVKLAAVLLVPTVVALVAGVLRIVDEAGAAPAYARISQVVGVQQQLSDLIGALARERDLATVFVASGRVGDRRALDLQFRAVDTDRGVLAGTTAQVPGLGFTRSPLAALGALEALRASVITGFGPVQVVVTEYSDSIDPLIELDSALTRQLDDAAVANDAAAVHALVAGREQISRQHAIVAAALYANRLGAGQIEDLRTATVRLTSAQDAVREALGPAERASAIAGIGPDAERSRQRLLRLVLSRGLVGEPLNTSPQEWDQRTAVVVDNISTVEKQLRQRIRATAQALLDHVRTAAGLNSVILFFALGLGVLVGIFVTRALLRPLAVLKRTALDVADRRLPEAMARIRDGELPDAAVEPVQVGTQEEIGQVARAFDEVHSQAVRLASEQAQLRANVSDIFVNLSRRTQGLVERQLKLIDRLESGEQDPHQLDNLFQLDHLATRMRRNSENLLVLAGTDAAGRSGRPVRLVDVLRAAVSEVEQYQRLVLQQPPAVLVLGSAASDLVHLLAELLDNATQFSPPDSQVMVSSDFASDGSVTIEVADCGVGMTEDELAEANERLANPPVVDVSVSRRMGLFVVGRLAARHDIVVQLRRAEGAVGVWACAILPATLVRVASETVEPSVATVAELAQTATGPQTNGQQTNGQGPQSAGQPVAHDPPTDAEQPQVLATPSAQEQPQPAPPGPPASVTAKRSVDVVAAGSGEDLFRPARPATSGPTKPGTVAPGNRVTLQYSTPIFDDVASAWFKEHEAVPVRWTAPAARGAAGVTREISLPDAPLPDAPLPDTLPAKATAAAVASAPPLMRREPGKTLAQSPSGAGPSDAGPSSDGASGDAGKVLSPGQPARELEVTRSASVPVREWGAVDEGWRAAEALAVPVSADITGMGLPRRQPRALLVPGAAGGAEPAPSAPVRSAESIRGRLASYQQGIHEGRQARQSLDQEAGASSPEPRDGEEETK
ncbi:MAG: nitrate- and nitrite sensing domain-containing protein [Pseudonocardiaceae bacterium]